MTLNANGGADGNEPPAETDFLEKVAHAVAPTFDASANGDEPDFRPTTAADAPRDANPKDER